MKKLNIKSTLVLLIMVIMVSGFIVSCTSDTANATSGHQVELLSFGPSGLKHGQNIVFIGHNLDKITGIKLEGATIDKASFVSQSNERIELTIPMSTVEGKAILMYDGGEVVSKTILSFDVPFIISNITAEVKPGQNLTITGQYLNWVKSIVFTDAVVVTEFVSRSLTQLVVKVPLNAKTGPIQIVGGGTEPYPYKSENDIKMLLPMITGVSPSPVKHSDLLTITGTNLDLAKSITFPNSAPIIGFESQNATTIVIRVPNTAKDGKLKVTAYSDVVTEASTSVSITLPAISAVAPTSVAIGSKLTLNGTNLDLVKQVIVPGASSPITSFVSQSATSIVFVVPALTFNGIIKFMTIKDYLVETTAKIQIEGLSSIPLARVIFDDALQNGFNDWSWSVKTSVITNEVKDGAKALRVDFTGDGGLKLANANLSTKGMTELVFSIYGGAGLGNSGKLGLMVNGKWSIKSIQTVQGAWTEYVIPISELVSLGVTDATDSIKEMALQNSQGYFIIDKVGLR